MDKKKVPNSVKIRCSNNKPEAETLWVKVKKTKKDLIILGQLMIILFRKP